MSKKLEVVLRKMKVNELKKEISKENIKGYSKMRKEEIINLMLDNKKRFKYLVLDNLKQKKELLEDKVKLKKAKEKLEKLTAKKIPAKKPEKAEIIKPKPKREPMIPKVIEAKPQTIKKGGKFVTVKKELKDIDLLELKLKNLQNDFSNTKSPGDAKNSKEAQKRVEIRDKLMSQIRKVKAQIFDSKQKNKIKSEKDKKQKEKDELKEFRKKIEEFIENPNDELLQEIDQKFELLDELPQFLQDKFDDAMEKYEKKEEPKKETKINDLIKLASQESKTIKEEKDDIDDSLINILYDGKYNVAIELSLDIDEKELMLEHFTANREPNKIKVDKGFPRLLLCEMIKKVQKKYKLKDDDLIRVDASDLRPNVSNPDSEVLFKKVYEPLGFEKVKGKSDKDLVEGTTTIKNIINKCGLFKKKFE